MGSLFCTDTHTNIVWSTMAIFMGIFAVLVVAVVYCLRSSVLDVYMQYE